MEERSVLYNFNTDFSKKHLIEKKNIHSVEKWKEVSIKVKFNNVNSPMRPIRLLGKILSNKKVLLRERKRHTARHIASTCYAAPVLCLHLGMGYPPDLERDTPHPDLGRGYPPVSWMGYPPPKMRTDRHL